MIQRYQIGHAIFAKRHPIGDYANRRYDQLRIARIKRAHRAGCRAVALAELARSEAAE